MTLRLEIRLDMTSGPLFWLWWRDEVEPLLERWRECRWVRGGTDELSIYWFSYSMVFYRRIDSKAHGVMHICKPGGATVRALRQVVVAATARRGESEMKGQAGSVSSRQLILQ